MSMFARARIFACAVLALGLAGGSALAGSATPVGSWQVSTGEARVNVTLCGDGTELCAKLVWLSETAKTDDNLRLLNGYVVNRAKPTGEGWTGIVHFAGNTATGKIKLVSRDTILVSGCKLICKTFEFHRL